MIKMGVTIIKIGDKLEVVTDEYDDAPRGTILTVIKVYSDTLDHFDTDDPSGKCPMLMFWSHAITGGYLKPLSPGPLPFTPLTGAESHTLYSIYKLTKWANITNPVCECGTDKHGFASHSGWCPKA